jgi:phage N-6-adenine-methyltransferase
MGASLHRGHSAQDYQTPPEFIQAVKQLLGIQAFDIDLAASPENAQASTSYTKEQDSLVQPWVYNGWGWLNPPYANIRPWVAKAWRVSKAQQNTRMYLGHDHARGIAMLVPASVGANWWAFFVHGEATVLFLNGRLTFVGQTTPYPKDCALLLYGPITISWVEHSKPYGVWDWKSGRRPF